MKRVMFVGCPGSGKTTLSEKFAAKMGLPLVHLDHLFWLPGWVQRHKAEFEELVKAELAKEEWVMDGNYGSTMELRVQRADMVVFLDFNRFFCIYRVLKRTWQQQYDQAEGCPQKVDWEFIGFILFNYPKRSRRVTLELMQKYPDIKWHHLKGPRGVKRFMKEFGL